MRTDWSLVTTRLVYLCTGIAAGAYWGWVAFIGFPLGVFIGSIVVSEFQIVRAPR